MFTFPFKLLSTTFSYHRYPLRFIHSRFNKFFTNHLATSHVLPMINNENDFVTMRHHLMNQPTVPDYQIASRLAKTIDVNSKEEVNDPLIKARLNKNSKWISSLIIHYTHERRLASYKKEIDQLWNQIFQRTPLQNTRLIIGNRNSENMTKELVRRRPKT